MISRTVPRTIVKGWLRLGRLPLTAAETLVLRGGSREAWPPRLVYEGMEATLKQLAGSLLRDRDLADEGRLQEAKVDELRRAARLEAEAEQRRLEADRELQNRREQNQQREEAARRRAEQQEEAAARREAEEERRVREQHAAEKAAARRVEEASRAAVAREERAARKVRVGAEQSALREAREAVEARGEALEVEQALERTRARRKADS